MRWGGHASMICHGKRTAADERRPENWPGQKQRAKSHSALIEYERWAEQLLDGSYGCVGPHLPSWRRCKVVYLKIRYQANLKLIKIKYSKELQA